MSFAGSPSVLRDNLRKFARFQRMSFALLMNSVECYFCNNFRYIALDCKSHQIKVYRQNMQRRCKYPQVRNQGRSLPSRRPFYIRYKNCFYGYCYSCKAFGHKLIDCKPYAKKNRNALYVKGNSYVDNSIRRHESFPPFLGQIRCYKCDNLGHMTKDCKFPSSLTQN